MKGKIMITEIFDKNEKKVISRKILEALTEWFEVEESREQYIVGSADMPLFAAEENGEYIGFLCLKETGRDTVELAVMGVLKEYHREGIGRQLVEKAVEAAKSAGYSFMKVKTVQMGKSYHQYGRRRGSRRAG